MWLATAFGVVGAFELLISEDEIEIFVQLLVLSPFDRTLLKLLETVHLARSPQRSTALCFLPYAFHFLSEIE